MMGRILKEKAKEIKLMRAKMSYMEDLSIWCVHVHMHKC